MENIIPLNTQFTGFEVKYRLENKQEKILLLNARQVIQRGQQLILLNVEDITSFK